MTNPVTIDQLNKLTDEEVRVRVANILFPQFPTYWDGENLRHRYPSGSTGPAFNYPSDLNAAFTLVEKLRGEGWSYVSVGPNNHANWFVDFAQHGIIHRAEHPSLARAICVAFIAVTEREEG